MEPTRNLRLLATGILLAGTVSVLHAQGSGFVNDICVPDKMYMFADTINTFFVEPLVSRWRPYHDVVRFSGNASYVMRTGRMVSVRPDPGSLPFMAVDLVNTDEFSVLKSDTVQVIASEKRKGSKDISAQILWQYSFLEKLSSGAERGIE